MECSADSERAARGDGYRWEGGAKSLSPLPPASARYVNSDDCWAQLGRDNRTGRIRSAFFAGSSDGGDAGMRNLSAYIHGKPPLRPRPLGMLG